MPKFFPRSSLCITVFLITVIFQCTPLYAALYEDISALDKITNRQELTAFLEKMHQKSLDRGMLNFVSSSLFLVKKSQQALKAKDYKRAEILTEYAQKLSPDIPVVYTARGIALWSSNKLYINLLIQGYLKAFIKECTSKSIDDLCFFTLRNLSVITGAFLLTLCVFAILSTLKYFTLAIHDLRHVISKAVPDPVVFGFVILIFLLPVFLGFSFFWMCLYWLFILFTYHTKIERALITGFTLGCVLLLPLLLAAASFCISMPQSDLIRLLWKTNYSAWNQKDIEDLERFAGTLPNDRDILLSLGLVNKREANYRTAQKYYERLLNTDPLSYKAHTNLGNVFLATQKWDEAVAHYQEAISLAPSLSAFAHFNFARAYQQ
ncbi:MAG: tetratricopeptide repeat protein, partial [Pseudomonadota bacterium]